MKTVHKAPTHMPTDLGHIPPEIRDIHQEVTLGIDVFFIHSIPFLITLSRNIYFTAVMRMPNHQIITIFKASKGIFTYFSSMASE